MSTQLTGKKEHKTDPSCFPKSSPEECARVLDVEHFTRNVHLLVDDVGHFSFAAGANTAEWKTAQ